MPYKINPITSNFDYYESQVGESYFTGQYGSDSWQENTLIVVHLLKSISPKVSTYELGELVTFKVDVIDEDTILLTKNWENPTPNILTVGVTK